MMWRADRATTLTWRTRLRACFLILTARPKSITIEMVGYEA